MKKNKYYKTDCETMSFLQKGEILYLASKKKTLKQISEQTKRSVDWIKTIIEALNGTKAKKELIDYYDRINNTPEGSVNRKSKSNIKRSTNKRNNKRKTRKTVFKHSTTRHRISKSERCDCKNNTRHDSIVESLRKHQDYAGE